MAHMNAFDSDVFGMMQLSATLLDQPHLPKRLGELGIFEEEGIRTTSLTVEQQGNTLVLVQTTPRGGPAIQNIPDQRNLVSIPTARIAVEDAMTADEVQNLRAFGSESDLTTLQAEVNKRNLRMSNSIEATMEHQRAGAINGLVLDADGSTLVDLFTTFGVSAQTPVDFDLAAGVAGALREKCSAVIRSIEDELGGLPYSGIHAMCGADFFDALTSNGEYRENKLSWEAASALEQRIAGRRVDFGGITFEEYRGNVGGMAYVPVDQAKIFPIGVPSLFLTRYAPAEYWETVNTVGLPRYARQVPSADPSVQRIFRVQSQVVNICTRPRVLFSGTIT